jgi:transposase-like protein
MRGVAHPDELRAQVVAAVIAGATISQAARQYGLSKQTVSRWVAEAGVGTLGTESGAREDGTTLEELLLDLVAEHAITLRAELQAAARPDWLEKQSAADLAQLVVAQRDTLIRLLAGFRPVDPEREPSVLDAPGASEDA